jgi:hypothetical protein
MEREPTFTGISRQWFLAKPHTAQCSAVFFGLELALRCFLPTATTHNEQWAASLPPPQALPQA